MAHVRDAHPYEPFPVDKVAAAVADVTREVRRQRLNGALRPRRRGGSARASRVRRSAAVCAS